MGSKAFALSEGRGIPFVYVVCKVSKEDMPILPGRPAALPENFGWKFLRVQRDFKRKNNRQEFGVFHIYGQTAFVRLWVICYPGNCEPREPPLWAHLVSH